MNLLERLRELAKSGERRKGESLGEWADRFNMENAGLRNEGLPLLLDVVEAVQVCVEKPCWDSLQLMKAALAKLEVEA